MYCSRAISSLVDILSITDVWLFDFDVRITEQTFEECVEDTSFNLGHAFIIKKFVEDNYEEYAAK
jgi:hypothetical protein